MFSRLPHLRNDIFTLVPPRFFCFLQNFRFHRVHREIALQVLRCWKHLNSGNHCCGNWSMRMVLAPVASGSMLPSGHQPWLENHRWLRDFTAMITRGSCFLMFVFKTIFQMKSLKKDMQVLTCAQFWLLFGKAADLYLPQSWIWLGPNCECKEDFSKETHVLVGCIYTYVVCIYIYKNMYVYVIYPSSQGA